LTALYILSATVGGAVGHPIASWIITDVSYAGYGMSMLVLSVITIVIAVVAMPSLVDDTTTVRIPSRSMRELLRTSRVWAILVMRGLATVNYGAMLLLVPLLLDTLTNDPGLVAAYGSTSLVMASLAQFGAGRAADRWGAQWPTAVSFAVMVGGSLFLAMAHTTVVGLFVGGVISIAAAWALATLMFIWVADGVPQRDHATLFGLLIAVWSISMIIGSLTAGRLVEIAPASPFVVVGVIFPAEIAKATRLSAVPKSEIKLPTVALNCEASVKPSIRPSGSPATLVSKKVGNVPTPVFDASARPSRSVLRRTQTTLDNVA
jgi:MFS family permease